VPGSTTADTIATCCRLLGGVKAVEDACATASAAVGASDAACEQLQRIPSVACAPPFCGRGASLLGAPFRFCCVAVLLHAGSAALAARARAAAADVAVSLHQMVATSHLLLALPAVAQPEYSTKLLLDIIATMKTAPADVSTLAALSLSELCARGVALPHDLPAVRSSLESAAAQISGAVARLLPE